MKKIKIGKIPIPALVSTIIFLIAINLSIGTESPKTVPTNEIKTASAKGLNEIQQITVDIKGDCQYSQSDCWEQKIRAKLLDKYTTAEILQSIYDFDTYYSCHAFAHFIGRTLYKKLDSIPDAYSQIDFTCHGGTYHGVMEAFLDKRKTTIDSLSGREIEQICADSPIKAAKNQNQIFTECLHGFGHAFMFITNSDLPASLDYCDRLNQSTQERCWGGAFMENSTSSTNKDHPTQWLKANDKFYPCTILNEAYLKQCYFYQANYLLKVTNRNYQRVFSDCSEVKNSGHHDYCILGLGAQLASVTNEQGVDVAANVCQIGKSKDALGPQRSEDRRHSDAYTCIEGAVPSLFARYGGDAPQIFEFCAKNPLYLRQFCFAKLGSVAKTYWQYDQARLVVICQNAKEYEANCLGNPESDFKY